jgi:hypothetical protein
MGYIGVDVFIFTKHKKSYRKDRLRLRNNEPNMLAQTFKRC